MIPWQEISKIILGDYENEKRTHKRLRGSYKDEITRLQREQKVRRVDDFNKSNIDTEIYDLHVEVDDIIQRSGSQISGYYEIDDECVEEVENKIEQVIKKCGSQIEEYNWRKKRNKWIFLGLVALAVVLVTFGVL